MIKRNDEAAVRGLMEAFVNGWNAGDGEACARPFAHDADFTAIHGLRGHDRDTIARAHDEVLSTIFRGVKLRATVDSVRFLRPDVAVAEFTLESDNFPFGLKRSMPVMVATKENGAWSIAVFHNMIPFDRPPAGPIERDLLEMPLAR